MKDRSSIDGVPGEQTIPMRGHSFFLHTKLIRQTKTHLSRPVYQLAVASSPPPR